MASPIYSQISANQRRTVLLVAGFVLFLVLLGWVFGQVNGDAYGGLTFAGIIAVVSALFSYYQGDTVALWTAGAKPLSSEQSPYVHRMVENLAISQGLPMPKLYLINDPAINAFATGRDPKHASVAVTTGAIEKLANEELEGVLAHELAHIQNYDIRVMTLVVVLVGTIAIFADMFLHSRMRLGDDDDHRAALPFLILGIVLSLVSPLIAELIKLAVSRRREYLADATGALTTRFPEGLARALEKIAADGKPVRRASAATAHLYFANPFAAKRLANFFSTHPPVEDRIRILRQMTA